MSRISAIIVNWNRREDTLNTIQQLGDINIGSNSLDVVIVDNHSSDESLKSFKALTNKIPNLHLVESQSNLGYAGGNNLGIVYAQENLKPDFLLILNNDIDFKKDFLTNLHTQINKDPKNGIVSPKIYFAKGYEFHKDRYSNKDLGKVIWYAGGKLDWKNMYANHIAVDEVDNDRFTKTISTDFASGACMLIRNSLIQKIGLFDEKYFLYWEDVDLSQRAIKAGYKLLLVPSAKIWHRVWSSSGIGSNLNDYYLTRNRMLFGFRYALKRTVIALIKESIKLLILGRKWQRIGIKDFYLGNSGKGSWK